MNEREIRTGYDITRDAWVIQVVIPVSCLMYDRDDHPDGQKKGVALIAERIKAAIESALKS